MSDSQTTSTEPSSDMVEKIRKLFQLAERGGTQEESEAAMAAAQKLMVKHGIDRMLVATAELEADRKSRPFNIVEKELKTGRTRQAADNYMARIIMSCMSVRVLWSVDYEWIVGFRRAENTWSGEQEPRDRFVKRLVYCLVGDETDVDASIVLVIELIPIMRRLYAAYLRERGLTWSSASCHSFYEGLTQAYIKANEQSTEQALLEVDKGVAGQYAVLLVDKEKASDEYIKQNIKTVRARSRSGPKAGEFDYGAYEHGQKAGEKLDLTKKRLKN